MIELMTLPFITCLILTGIHAYLGMHIVRRGVIFVDLALAQVAALGSIVAVLVGIPLHTTAAYSVSLAFTFLGAILFSITRFEKHRVPQEAIIGIVYVISAAAAVLVLDRIPSESQHMKEMLVGNILFINSEQVLKMGLLYVAIGIFYWVFRKKFLIISQSPTHAREKGIRIGFWDFLFYAVFGLVVTSSVEIAGVLLVFSFLIIPAVCAMLLVNGFAHQLWLAWLLGAATSFAGIYGSAAMDLPTGAAIVCSFGMLFTGVVLTAGVTKKS